MLAFIIDVAGAYFIAKHINKIWIQIILVFFVGIASSVTGNLITFLLLQDSMDLGEAFQRMVVGIMWHPLITMVACRYFYRKFQKKILPK